MIYTKPENPKCNICVHAHVTENSSNLQCKLRGTVPSDFCCKKFKYDIFKKKLAPRRKLKNNEFKKDDFII